MTDQNKNQIDGTAKPSGAAYVRRKKINWIKLREKFFYECTNAIKYESTGTQTQMRRINLAPHDLFEWFKRNIQNA